MLRPVPAGSGHLNSCSSQGNIEIGLREHYSKSSHGEMEEGQLSFSNLLVHAWLN